MIAPRLQSSHPRQASHSSPLTRPPAGPRSQKSPVSLLGTRRPPCTRGACGAWRVAFLLCSGACRQHTLAAPFHPRPIPNHRSALPASGTSSLRPASSTNPPTFLLQCPNLPLLCTPHPYSPTLLPSLIPHFTLLSEHAPSRVPIPISVSVSVSVTPRPLSALPPPLLFFLRHLHPPTHLCSRAASDLPLTQCLLLVITSVHQLSSLRLRHLRRRPSTPAPHSFY